MDYDNDSEEIMLISQRQISATSDTLRRHRGGL